VVDDDVDYSALERTPLPEAALRASQYMSDVESHTICHLRGLLVTPSHQDPEITTFLTMWAYEEFWHGEVLDKVWPHTAGPCRLWAVTGPDGPSRTDHGGRPHPAAGDPARGLLRQPDDAAGPGTGPAQRTGSMLWFPAALSGAQPLSDPEW
jgi:hypothetical protein